MDGYRSLAQHMNRVAQTDWSEKTARSRFESFMAAYRKAKRQSPHNLPLVFQRVDVLFGTNGDVQNIFRLESLGQKVKESRPSLVSKKKHETVLQDLLVANTEVKIKVASGEQKSQELTTPNTNDHALNIESQRLAVKQEELKLKQSELLTRHEENRQKLRAEVLTRLVEAGKSPAEVREYLAIMDAVDNPSSTRP
ncbi:unnamed protein product [Peronospora farinosa]|uniref:Uncharacterized protein n=1 Tax=Peronospora farinosa TaxID=134698 RepID=A0AAV0UH28_9STRA|nr:unnamed protein product [Peronospora farinosa]CAI5735473.1 unnamed protein product [Peronospora farinosa]